MRSSIGSPPFFSMTFSILSTTIPFIWQKGGWEGRGRRKEKGGEGGGGGGKCELSIKGNFNPKICVVRKRELASNGHDAFKLEKV